MFRRYTYKLYPTEIQRNTLEEWSNVCRSVYNACLQQRWDALAKQRKWVSYNEQSTELTELREGFDWIRRVSRNCVSTSSLRRADLAFERWAKHKISKKPKYKNKKAGFWTLSFNAAKRFRIKNNKLRLEKIGDIRIRGATRRPGIQKECNIFKKADCYYASVTYLLEEFHSCQLPKSIGLDIGITDFLADSNGKTIRSPRVFIKAQKKLRIVNKSLTRKQKGSSRYKKAKGKYGLLHNKIKNQRLDFLHKISRLYADSQGVVIMEDLKIRNLVKNSHLSKHIKDQAWGKFKILLEYKLKENQGILLSVGSMNTSKVCHLCQNMGERDRKIFTCLIHGPMDADINAAKNILNKGLKSLKTNDLTIVEKAAIKSASMKRLGILNSSLIDGVHTL